MGFQHDMPVAFDRRPCPDHGNGWERFVREPVYLRDENARQDRVVMPDRQVGRRKAQVAADLVAVNDVAGHHVGFFQQLDGLGEIAFLKRIPDTGR